MVSSTELIFSLLEIGLCFTLILSFNLKLIPSNKDVKHDVLGDYIICVETSKEYGEALRPAKFVSDDSACDQANFVKN